MTARRASVVIAVLAALAPAALARADDPGEPGPPARIGRYQLTRSGGVLAIGVPGDARVAGWCGLASLVLLGAAVRLRRRRAAMTGVVLAALGVAVVGVAPQLAGTRWRASPAELVREPALGAARRWSRAEIAAIEVVRRAPSGEERRRASGRRPWDVRVRGRDGAEIPLRFALQSEPEARSLARELGQALGVEVRARAAGAGDGT